MGSGWSLTADPIYVEFRLAYEPPYICYRNLPDKWRPTESVSKTMGYKNIRTTQRYAKVTNDKVSRDMGKLSDVLQNIEQFKY